MPLTAPRLDKSHGGARSVFYRDANGKTRAAVVIGEGSTSGVKLKVGSLRNAGNASSVKDNVLLATGLKQTNVYFNR